MEQHDGIGTDHLSLKIPTVSLLGPVKAEIHQPSSEAPPLTAGGFDVKDPIEHIRQNSLTVSPRSSTITQYR